MFGKAGARGLIAFIMALAAGFVDRAMADYISPVGLPLGSQYQLIFVTNDLTTATNSNIGYYDAFVAAEAAANHSLPAGVTWDAVISTTTVNAIDNAPSSGLAVYNTAGVEVASSTTGLYTPNLLADIIDTQFGTPTSTESVWTGSYPDGLVSENPAGTAGVEWGEAYTSDSDWIHEVGGPSSYELPLYALSSPITVVPEPCTFTLALGAVGLSNRRRTKTSCRKPRPQPQGN